MPFDWLTRQFGGLCFHKPTKDIRPHPLTYHFLCHTNAGKDWTQNIVPMLDIKSWLWMWWTKALVARVTWHIKCWVQVQLDILVGQHKRTPQSLEGKQIFHYKKHIQGSRAPGKSTYPRIWGNSASTTPWFQQFNCVSFVFKLKQNHFFCFFRIKYWLPLCNNCHDCLSENQLSCVVKIH